MPRFVFFILTGIQSLLTYTGFYLIFNEAKPDVRNKLAFCIVVYYHLPLQFIVFL